MIIKAIQNRRSTRKYVENTIPREKIEALLEAAMLAPSACNSRPWRFIVITQREVLNKLADCHNYAKMLYKAPVTIVICALADEQAKNDIARGFYPQDCGAATQNILLQATEMGLASCWCGVYPKEPIVAAVREILALPEDEIPFNIIAIGEADDTPKMRGFYDVEKVRWID
ncbi:MAG: nitroreductase family protein [Defluviitaleaceae bacterium]|nr:nitroreductase family protein [Defluviitaleaceae bacterium]